ncbi:type II toxin-antitoxin system VapC family toxin [Lacihabitans lacunae]|uniref:Type II toxin-antitoxin system VapC family toxin n=1 Tax=Lacihabitans lacunae TaxID=1028214 RepID=A0ABV7YS93_9BACT
MKYLLDTHTLIWAITNKEKLSKKVKNILESSETVIYVSAISYWEISLKFALGKIDLIGGDSQDLLNESLKLGFTNIPLKPEICTTFKNLTANYHRDPFDRMLIWKSISENYTLLTKDESIKLYKTEGLKTIW